MELPDLTHHLIRRKYQDLKKGQDDLKYIEEAVARKQKHTKLMAHLRERYDYRNKTVVNHDRLSEKQLDRLREKKGDSMIVGFKSQIREQIREGRNKVSKFELLRAHIRNYQMLTDKEKRTVLGYIGARRARDSRKIFREELSLLAQKIAHENRQREAAN